MYKQRVFIGILITLSLFFMEENKNNAQVMSNNEKDKSTLYDLCKMSNKTRYVHEINTRRGVNYASIEDIAKRSDVIVIGHVLGNRMRLSTDGKSINTTYPIYIQGKIKSTNILPKAIILSNPLGIHRYSDNTIVEVHDRYFRPIQKDGKYMLFLKKAKNSQNEWNLVGGSQGQYKLDFVANKLLPGDTRMKNGIGRNYKDMKPGDFIQYVRSIKK